LVKYISHLQRMDYLIAVKMAGLIGEFFLLYGIVSIVCKFWTLRDFQKRVFPGKDDKTYWRRAITLKPVGVFYILQDFF